MIEEDDDVIDFLIMEAVAVKVMKEDEKQEKARERERFKKDPEGLERLRSMAGA